MHSAKDRLVKVLWISLLGTTYSMRCSAEYSWYVTSYFAEQDDGQIGKVPSSRITTASQALKVAIGLVCVDYSV
jgi:hypothetical protein